MKRIIPLSLIGSAIVLCLAATSGQAAVSGVQSSGSRCRACVDRQQDRLARAPAPSPLLVEPSPPSLPLDPRKAPPDLVQCPVHCTFLLCPDSSAREGYLDAQAGGIVAEDDAGPVQLGDRRDKA